jgi:two-component system nitrogen regulation response regulator NtrX
VTARVLIVEDERAIQLALSGLLRRVGLDVEQAYSGEEAIRMLHGGAFDLVVTDLSLGGRATGIDVLRASKDARPEAAVILITAHGSEKVAVEAMKAGAEDYLPKPFDNDEMRVVVTRALERTRLTREHRMLLERVGRDYGLGAMIGAGTAMRTAFAQIEKVAETDLTVLVRGESGTGKELVAQAIHESSGRARRPFVAINCAAISRDLVESELFGHEKGAFTGASARRVGRFESAHEGTIFLDEIGDMPLETQAKVLRVLEERSFERVGGSKPIAVDVRVIAATHRDLEADVARGGYRADLYYRLRVVELVVPPLRERLEDLPALVGRFLDQLSVRLGREKKSVSDGAMARLGRHDWPGNVRELRNVIEQASVLASGECIEEADLRLTASVRVAGAGQDLPTSFAEAKRQAVERFERTYLTGMLDRHGGNISQTAEAIGMARQSLQQKLKELGIRADDHKG